MPIPNSRSACPATYPLPNNRLRATPAPAGHAREKAEFRVITPRAKAGLRVIMPCEKAGLRVITQILRDWG
jgi:hypothetical protein